MDQLNLNMRQRRWLDVVKDYDHEILYNLSKENVVMDALSRKSVGSSAGWIRHIVLKEAHKYRFSIHTRATKMYRELRLSYWWLCMK